MLRLFHGRLERPHVGSVTKLSCGLFWTEMVRRFGFPTLDVAIGMVETRASTSRASDGRRLKGPSRDQEGHVEPVSTPPSVYQKHPKTLGFPVWTE